MKTPQQAFRFVVGDYISTYLLPYPERPTPDDGMMEMCVSANASTEIGQPASLTGVGMAVRSDLFTDRSWCVLPILMQLLLASTTWLMSGCELHFSQPPTNEKRSIAAARART